MIVGALANVLGEDKGIMKLGLNQNSEPGFGPLKGLHSISRNQYPQTERRSVNHVSKNETAEHTLHRMMLPEIKSSRLDIIENSQNPFRVIKKAEQLLVFREKQRELESLEIAKLKIERKFLKGDEHIKLLSTNKGRERTGLIREISNIPPLSFHQRSSSV